MGNISIIGSRSTGKTTYLAGLVGSPKGSRRRKSYSVTPVGIDANNLCEEADMIISAGMSLAPTEFAQTKDRDYGLVIDLNQGFGKKERLQLQVKDFAGEVFDELGKLQPLTSQHEDFIRDFCLMKDYEGCLLLVSEWGAGKDFYYKRIVQEFIKRLDKYRPNKDFRVAVAMSKCERGELWAGRLEPEIDIFKTYLPQTTAILRDEAKIPKENVNFYAISTFGVLGRNDPRPNRTNMLGKNTQSVLREPPNWHPYNLIAPLYWLSTGKWMDADA
jgi:hypothetical protein